MSVHIIVIPDDETVIIDGVARTCAFEAPPEAHGFDWDGECGFMQRRPSHGGGLVWLESAAALAAYVAAWEAAAEPPAEGDAP